MVTIYLFPGIQCPRGSRPDRDGSTIPAEPFGDAATLFTKERIIQRDVEVQVCLYWYLQFAVTA